MDQVDRMVVKLQNHAHIRSSRDDNLAEDKSRSQQDSEQDKLTPSISSSGSIITTDCAAESSSRSSSTFEKKPHPVVPIGLKVVSLVSMVTAIILIAASGILLHKTNQTLMAWLKAAPTTMTLLAQVNHLLGGTTGIVEEVENQEKYLKILISCSAVLVITGMVQLLCNIWFFCRMNSPCIRRCMSKSEQFFCGI